MTERSRGSRSGWQIAHAIVTLALAVLVVVAFAQCRTPDGPVVFLGSPHERFDHNRTLRYRTFDHVVATGIDVTERHTITLDKIAEESTFVPAPPDKVPAHGETGADGLRVAHLVPRFSGIALPLSAEPPEDGNDSRSDTDDLVDYLGSGIASGAGLEPGEMMETTATEVSARFAPVLELLQDTEGLRDRAAVQAWAERHDAAVSFAIVDPRFRAGAFADRVAVRFVDHWFVLFAVPGAAGGASTGGFTRLVVVPVKLEGQDFDAKTPRGGRR